MKLELFYKNGCGFCASVLNTIQNLKIQDKVQLKNINENIEFEKDLVIESGDKQVPTLFVDGKPMQESEEIKKFLVQSFM
ncbi:MAG: glutaredoxin [Deltaproteobacteria bacterium]|jgi:glutaredoxin|uniref:glutaredoxin family protein n=1 Tax=Desulfobacula sp. TaxID=2593537 RepID=UPI001F9D8C64|nr:glutaredoxin [Deltaproteobacteria bacterium]MBT7632074.1 glutaredoxin [Desulfobacula sp.]MBT4091565.1 glutaredoxin [Deltaproteobacteria bacterium]MBT4263742.1 glutaredoxin [Deltaproteobacteria bacterium]MBT4643359.1 glutaredoxin [Deltaproteobacteria bacterium]